MITLQPCLSSCHPNPDAVRAHFPALSDAASSSTAFLDNAGGSQLPGVVIDAMTRYMRECFVQLGADYAVSQRASAIVAAAHRFLLTFVNGHDDSTTPGAGLGHVIMGASTSQLMLTLSTAMAPTLSPGDEIIISQASHESNAGCWERLARPESAFGRGVKIVIWPVDQTTHTHSLDTLNQLITPRTRLVCFPHVCNILGEVMDVSAITRLAHARGAKVIVDGVAFAPHRAVDVRAWNCDAYVFSTYKVFGPHLGALFCTHELLEPLTGPNHFFIPRTELPRKFELGGVSHELAAGVLALDHYLRDLVELPRLTDLADPRTRFDRTVVTRGFDIVRTLEDPLNERLLAYLSNRPGVRIIGDTRPGVDRVCIVSFTRDGKSSRDIAQAGNAQGLGFRFGNFYAHRLCTGLGLDPADGVVRVSLAHYNTHAELDRLFAFFDRTL